jgi:hypothetical protein
MRAELPEKGRKAQMRSDSEAEGHGSAIEPMTMKGGGVHPRGPKPKPRTVMSVAIDAGIFEGSTDTTIGAEPYQSA